MTALIIILATVYGAMVRHLMGGWGGGFGITHSMCVVLFSLLLVPAGIHYFMTPDFWIAPVLAALLYGDMLLGQNYEKLPLLAARFLPFPVAVAALTSCWWVAPAGAFPVLVAALLFNKQVPTWGPNNFIDGWEAYYELAAGAAAGFTFVGCVVL